MPAITYIKGDAASCLEKVVTKARELGATVHMPRIGCACAERE